jgi:hypothetical protein
MGGQERGGDLGIWGPGRGGGLEHLWGSGQRWGSWTFREGQDRSEGPGIQKSLGQRAFGVAGWGQVLGTVARGLGLTMCWSLSRCTTRAVHSPMGTRSGEAL